MDGQDTVMPNGQRIPNGMLEDNAPRNMWWVAAHAREVTEKPLARWILETPVVLYRLEDGTPAALYDRCPHRCPKVTWMATSWSALITAWNSTQMVCAPKLRPST